MTNRAARALRGAVFAVCATLIAAVAHTFAGGGAPSPLFCLVAAALVLPVTTAIARRAPSLGRTGLAIGGAQALFHTMFAITGDLGRWQPAAHSAHTHQHGAFAPDALPAVAGLVPDLGMLIAHAVAAALTVAAVYRGERVVRAVRDWLPRLVRRLLAVVPVSVFPRAPRADVRVDFRPAARVLVGAMGRRGPPRDAALPA